MALVRGTSPGVPRYRFPQLRYDFVVHVRPPTAREVEESVAHETFDLEVLSGGLVIRDGFDLLDWEPVASDEIRFPLPADSYHVTSLFWAASPAGDQDMTIALCFEATDDDLVGSGWPYLEYFVAGGP